MRGKDRDVVICATEILETQKSLQTSIYCDFRHAFRRHVRRTKSSLKELTAGVYLLHSPVTFAGKSPRREEDDYSCFHGRLRVTD